MNKAPNEYDFRRPAERFGQVVDPESLVRRDEIQRRRHADGSDHAARAKLDTHLFVLADYLCAPSEPPRNLGMPLERTCLLDRVEVRFRRGPKLPAASAEASSHRLGRDFASLYGLQQRSE